MTSDHAIKANRVRQMRITWFSAKLYIIVFNNGIVFAVYTRILCGRFRMFPPMLPDSIVIVFGFRSRHFSVNGMAKRNQSEPFSYKNVLVQTPPLKFVPPRILIIIFDLYIINFSRFNFALCLGPKIFSTKLLWMTVHNLYDHNKNDRHANFYLCTFNMFGSVHFWNQFNSSPSCKMVLAHTKLDAWLISRAGNHTYTHTHTCAHTHTHTLNWKSSMERVLW